LPIALAILMLTAGCRDSQERTAAEPVRVVVVMSRRQPVTESLSLVGTLVANESVNIKAEVDGIVQEVLFEEGQPVANGQLLLRLDETKLAASLAEAESSFQLSEANFERAKQLFSEKLISQQEYDQASATYALNQAALELKKRQLKDARVHAPFEGVTGARNVSPGQVITKDTVLTSLVDLDPVKAAINVPERFLGQLAVGQEIEVGVAAFPDQKFRGKLYFVAPEIDPNTRTALVKALVPNPDRQLKPGMFANLDLTLTVRENSVVIPEPALSQMLEGDRATVFVVTADQTAELKTVRLGVRLAGWVEILSGLDGGESVIVEGTQKIGPGSKVTPAPPAAAQPYTNS
jgi:membrane fusion protein (multidrug efflux system)